MDSEMQESISPEFQAEEIKVDINPDEVATLTPVPVRETSDTNEQWRRIGERVSLFLSDLPDYLSDFFGEYKRPLITVGLVVGSVIAVKMILAILDAVNDIPLLAPTFELIGVGYTFWFVYRYLLKASSRQELTEDFTALKNQVMGGGSIKG